MSEVNNFIKKIIGKSVHIVGVTGAEGSNILRFLIKNNISNITAHDFLSDSSVEKSFKIWHKNIPAGKKEKLYQQFISDLKIVDFKTGKKYLENIESADIIFVPQSWRLYKKQNQLLWEAKSKNTPFYSLTRIYLDLSPAQIIAVTGTVGKGSVANLLVQLLKKSLPAGRQVYFAGNETWMMQAADRLTEMNKQDFLVLEVSHRQLQDGFSRAPHIVVVTNIYPNHLDEVNWEEYKSLKFSLIQAQKKGDISILNHDVADLREIARTLNSKIIYYSALNKNMNTNNIQNIYKAIMSIKSDQLNTNLLATMTTMNILGYNSQNLLPYLSTIPTLPARLQYLGNIGKISFYDDIKSTTPWATIAAIQKLGNSVIVICGGKSKKIDYQQFASFAASSVKYLIILKSQLSGQLSKYLPKSKYKIVEDLKTAMDSAYKIATNEDKILVSPAAGFFYSDFIKGKQSIRKIITSLPPKGLA